MEIEEVELELNGLQKELKSSRANWLTIIEGPSGRD
jgi:hypothetical protein